MKTLKRFQTNLATWRFQLSYVIGRSWLSFLFSLGLLWALMGRTFWHSIILTDLYVLCFRFCYHRPHWKGVCRFVAQDCKCCQCYCLRRTSAVCALSISKDDQSCVTSCKSRTFSNGPTLLNVPVIFRLIFFCSLSLCFANHNLLLVDCFQKFAHL